MGERAQFQQREGALALPAHNRRLNGTLTSTLTSRLRAIFAELAVQGHLNERGMPFNPKSFAAMLAA